VNKKKLFVHALGALAVLLLGVTFLARGCDRPTAPRSAPSEGKGPGYEDTTSTAKELRTLALQYHDRIEAIEGRSRSVEERLSKLEAELGRMGTLLESTLKAQAEILNSIHGALPQGNSPVPSVPRIGSFDLGTTADAPEKHPVIPPGSFGEGKLLTGVFAPVTGDAMPVLIKLSSLLVGPSRTRIPIAGAFLVGKATGDANSSRAIIQLHSLSFVDGDGKSVERKVNGWVVDADGIQGLAGRYVWNVKEMALLSGVSGTAQGMANAFANSQTTTSTSALGSVKEVTKNSVDYAGFQGASSALANIGKIIEERMREFVPSVYVGNADRSVTIVFLEGVSLESAQLESPVRHDRFRGLDAFDR
jgi:hypothetical protein